MMKMKAIKAGHLKGESILEQCQISLEELNHKKLRVKISYFGVNRADILQKNGLYPPPPGESNILGLEFAGEVIECGKETEKYWLGEHVCGLCASGAYGEYIDIYPEFLLKIPKPLTLKEAAVMPEAFLTAYQVFNFKKAIKNKTVLIHAGASGIGTAAIQIAKTNQNSVVVTASKQKHEYCFGLGADYCIDYKSQEFENEVRTIYNSGVDFILDMVGGPYFQKNLKCLSRNGRLHIIGFLGGVKLEKLNIAPIVSKNLEIVGTTLRDKNFIYKKQLISSFQSEFLKESFPFKINIDRVFSWKEIEEAHHYMESNSVRGKIVIEV